jgi:predicted MPP superfamily phosphohydrolase
VPADLHVGSPFNEIDKLREIAELMLEREPDLIALAGDYLIHGALGGQFVAPKDAAAEFASLEAPAGVFTVLGNHD